MAIDAKKYDAIHDKTGDDKNLLKDKFDENMHTIAVDHPDDFPELAAVVYQIGLMQEELDYLRSIIDTNNSKTTFPGFGTSGSTCLVGNTSLLALGTSSSTALAGDTTTITTAQAKAITTNTAKVSFPVLAEEGNSLSFAVEKSTLTIANAYTDPETGKTVSYSTRLTLK